MPEEPVSLKVAIERSSDFPSAYEEDGEETDSEPFEKKKWVIIEFRGRAGRRGDAKRGVVEEAELPEDESSKSSSEEGFSVVLSEEDIRCDFDREEYTTDW